MLKTTTAGILMVLAGVAALGSFPHVGSDELHVVPTQASSVKLLFVGDIFFDRTIRTAMRTQGDDYPLSCVAEKLREYDLVIGNLEGPITAHESVSEGSEVGSPENYTFTFATTTAHALARANIRLVNLGNNHISNFGREGIEETKRYLTDAKVNYFGGLREDIPIYRYVFSKPAVALVSFNEFGGLSVASTSALIIEETAVGNAVIVYAHWGEEYMEAPSRVREAARQFVAAGANLVIGSHPHVVLRREDIGRAPVYYSLGNFLFDQYWNEEVSQGLAVEVVLDGSSIAAVQEHKTRMYRDGRVCLAD